MPITALPSAPSRQDPTTFAIKADAWVAALAQFTTEANSLQTDVNASQVSATNSAAAASTSASNAAASAAAAGTSANALAWVNGQTYALNASAISQIDFTTYRKKTASSVTTIDPKNDSANWVSTIPVSVTSLLYSNTNFGGF